ncbi:uncharacterized protein LOC120529024 isoform X1 [Polypterus senegalus]|uniref:uncharacterized protein LOC120529024 isoform X1 n=1 Tax=Polypterus senegalus TaxID=55291 RepID=UPI00196561A8|nr:uncharacterized protein LOC120529024 isoform X1 [Polypterus senegalus]
MSTNAGCVLSGHQSVERLHVGGNTKSKYGVFQLEEDILQPFAECKNKMDNCSIVFLSKEERMSAIERVVKTAVETVVYVITRLNDCTIRDLQLRIAEKEKENELLKIRMELTERELTGRIHRLTAQNAAVTKNKRSDDPASERRLAKQLVGLPAEQGGLSPAVTDVENSAVESDTEQEVLADSDFSGAEEGLQGEKLACVKNEPLDWNFFEVALVNGPVPPEQNCGLLQPGSNSNSRNVFEVDSTSIKDESMDARPVIIKEEANDCEGLDVSWEVSKGGSSNCIQEEGLNKELLLKHNSVHIHPGLPKEFCYDLIKEGRDWIFKNGNFGSGTNFYQHEGPMYSYNSVTQKMNKVSATEKQHCYLGRLKAGTERGRMQKGKDQNRFTLCPNKTKNTALSEQYNPEQGVSRAALRQRRYRESLQRNGVYEEYKRQQALRSAAWRRREKTEEERERERALARIRARRYRERLKAAVGCIKKSTTT